MRALLLVPLFLVLFAGCGFLQDRVQPPEFVAFSLKAAEQALSSGHCDSLLIGNLAGITQVQGLVYDRANGDPIIIGRRGTVDTPVHLDDLVVALRARYLEKTWPQVSIEPADSLRNTGYHAVVTRGGIAGTGFGQDLVQADILLKKLTMGALQADSLASYVTLCERAVAAGQKTMDPAMLTRFWFKLPDAEVGPSINQRAGTFACSQIPLIVESEVCHRTSDGFLPVAADLNPESGAFAASVTDQLNNLDHPEIDKLDALFYHVALARGMEKLVDPEGLDFWLNRYQVAAEATPDVCRIIRRTVGNSGVDIQGGIQLKPHPAQDAFR
jgi:hypothetical protein